MTAPTSRIHPPDIPRAPERFERDNEQRFREVVGDTFRRLLQPLRKWTITQRAVPRVLTFDANTSTAQDTADTLAQLLMDLKERGVIE